MENEVCVTSNTEQRNYRNVLEQENLSTKNIGSCREEKDVEAEKGDMNPQTHDDIHNGLETEYKSHSRWCTSLTPSDMAKSHHLHLI